MYFVYLVSSEIYINILSILLVGYAVFTNLTLIWVNYSVNNYGVLTVVLEEV
jgi:hypothetical protein